MQWCCTKLILKRPARHSRLGKKCWPYPNAYDLWKQPLSQIDLERVYIHTPIGPTNLQTLPFFLNRYIGRKPWGLRFVGSIVEVSHAQDFNTLSFFLHGNAHASITRRLEKSCPMPSTYDVSYPQRAVSWWLLYIDNILNSTAIKWVQWAWILEATTPVKSKHLQPTVNRNDAVPPRYVRDTIRWPAIGLAPAFGHETLKEGSWKRPTRRGQWFSQTTWPAIQLAPTSSHTNLQRSRSLTHNILLLRNGSKHRSTNGQAASPHVLKGRKEALFRQDLGTRKPVPRWIFVQIASKNRLASWASVEIMTSNLNLFTVHDFSWPFQGGVCQMVNTVTPAIPSGRPQLFMITKERQMVSGQKATARQLRPSLAPFDNEKERHVRYEVSIPKNCLLSWILEQKKKVSHMISWIFPSSRNSIPTKVSNAEAL